MVDWGKLQQLWTEEDPEGYGKDPKTGGLEEYYGLNRGWLVSKGVTMEDQPDYHWIQASGPMTCDNEWHEIKEGDWVAVCFGGPSYGPGIHDVTKDGRFVKTETQYLLFYCEAGFEELTGETRESLPNGTENAKNI